MIRENYYNGVIKPLIIYRDKLLTKRGITAKILVFLVNRQLKKKWKTFYKILEDKYVK